MTEKNYLPSYIVTFHTFALLHGQHRNPFYTEVIENNQTFIVKKTPLEIMKESCVHYRSNFEAVVDSSKVDLKKRHKPPIMLTHAHNQPLLFFPLLSPSLHNNTWIAYHAVKDFQKGPKGVSVVLKNNENIQLNTSLATMYRQVALSHLLKQRFENSQEMLSSSYYMIMESNNSDSPIS